jgi:transposase
LGLWAQERLKEDQYLRYIALDLDKKNALAGLFDSDTQQTHQERLPLMSDTISLNHFVNSLRSDDILAMEAQPGSFYLYDLCKPKVKEVHILEPHWLGAILGREESKTDRNDTGLMLKLMRANVLKTVWVPPPDVRAQRILTAHYRRLDKERTRYLNRSQALLQDHGLAYEAANLLKADVKLVLIKLEGRMLPTAVQVLASTLRLLRVVDEELSLVKAQIQATIHPKRDIAVTLPGLDSLLASVALAFIGDVSRFQTPDSLANYCLVPSHKNTGGKVRHGKTKRRGSAHLRWAMVEAANSAKRVPGHLRDLYFKRLRRRGHDKAIVAVARKMVEILWHMLTKNEPYRDVPPATEKRKQQRRRRKFHEAQKVLKSRPDTIETLRLNISSVREVLQMMS